MMEDYHYRLEEAVSISLKAGSPSFQKELQYPSIFLCTEGSVFIRHSSGTRLQHGSLIFFEKGECITIDSPVTIDAELYLISFTPYVLSNAGTDELWYRRNYQMLPKSGLTKINVVEKIRKGADALVQGNDPSHIRQIYLLELLHEACLEEKRSRTGSALFEEALAFIQHHYHLPLKREDIAGEMGFHPHYFSRWFKEKAGRNFQTYISEIRIRKAQELLLETQLTIADIAAKVGFADNLYFSRVFKQKSGMTPSAYRFTEKRIIAFGFAETLLAIGIRPIAVDQMSWEKSPYLREQLPNTIVIDPWSFEKIKELKPEWIVAPAHINSNLLHTCKQICPVLTKEWLEPDPLTQLRDFGNLFRRQEESEAWCARFEMRAGQYRQQFSQNGLYEKTIACYEIAYGKCYVLDRLSRGSFVLYDVLGAKAPEPVKQEVLDTNQWLTVRADEVGPYTADIMIVTVYEEDQSRETREFLNSPSWQELTSSGIHTMIFPPYHLMRANSGISLENQLHALADALLNTDRYDNSPYE
ncbi:AraC family transcriptional regulator [Paenibacillus apiarius]|uniref:AraC family transcriptional regulator n=2 Tax=Paenibacillus apiarius TaxID=46240 RepID=A0ABT4DQD8_9BACL|nr:AraC family transcriptional regulator [Paenibacillus apiarius]MCY9514044.1 AraC family transcriptional regulator [Paenibacillus apiarius]MCY9519561.1 AraC family transcriptional regulator [Paenibacillus apiarius]MCY9556317.1 AraC family transcriptional regulator [Paenibacillus apiarius]MCY9681851.1 AraC family transcriptional regulator [Paenibacillus apiarius]MCY9726774.1 AraC family transcriptional regulator [Paenibacillus apiarius]